MKPPRSFVFALCAFTLELIVLACLSLWCPAKCGLGPLWTFRSSQICFHHQMPCEKSIPAARDWDCDKRSDWASGYSEIALSET